jgi:hypothetical protein
MTESRDDVVVSAPASIDLPYELISRDIGKTVRSGACLPNH